VIGEFAPGHLGDIADEGAVGFCGHCRCPSQKALIGASRL
jgi:hypothetical protein